MQTMLPIAAAIVIVSTIALAIMLRKKLKPRDNNFEKVYLDHAEL